MLFAVCNFQLGQGPPKCSEIVKELIDCNRLESTHRSDGFCRPANYCSLFSTWLEITFRKQHGSIYIDATHEPHPACDETVHCVMPHFLGWDEKASAKTDPYSVAH